MQHDGLAVPRDMAARHGAGVDLGLSLGGGGLFFVAWQVAYLHEMADRGLDLADVGRTVGTSAGSFVATSLCSGHLGRLHTELTLMSRLPGIVGALAPVGDLAASQVRARELFGSATDGEPSTIRAIGHAALAAATPSVATMPRNAAVVLGVRRWPASSLHLTCVDAFTGERCVVTRSHGVPIARAVAASSAVPGLFPPQPILDRRCMDGGVSGSGVHLDLLAGVRRSVVLALTDGADDVVGAMTVAPGSAEAELADLRASGSDVFFRTPESVDMDALMDPTAVPGALEMGRHQAAADAEELRDFLSPVARTR